MISIKIDDRQMRKLTRSLRKIRDGVPRALAPAINRALQHGRTQVKRQIREHYIIKAKDIPISVRRANYSSLTGHLVLRDSMLDTNKFRYTPRGRSTPRSKPLFVQVKKKSGGGRIKHGFVNAVGSYSGPFVRIHVPRFPIKKLITIGAPIMATQLQVGPVINKAMGDTLAKRIDHEIGRVMAQAGGKS